ncbi:Branched-chain amino acid ABC transporter substrate-binding protein [Frankia sp. AiPs1]|uniref:ABC transporter substrate-binding protein n=1 Tax=Frankia sp. AiPa1 TaxID=573492 RepID=UPI00202AEA89|nr:ABC transporter substrate-binding protein [Frankia sp. AiPa1]MCL9760036.1 ABC transporter substrate-binding protein [Frankia sp. AiPa1]
MKYIRRLSVLAVALGLALVACSNASSGGGGGGGSTGSAPANSANGAPGVSASEIRFAALGTNSNNPLGTCVLDCYAQGVKAYFAYQNSKGGVFGRKLVLSKLVDDQLGQNKQGALQIITANDTFATFSAPQLATGWPDLAKAGIPNYADPYFPADMAGKDSAYSTVGMNCIECTSRTYPYAAQLLGAKKIAALGYGVSENSKQCVNSVVATTKLYAAQTGQSVVYSNNSLPFGLPNGIGPEVSAMKRAGAQAIMLCIDLNGAKTVATELQRQGVSNAKLVMPNTYDKDFLAKAGNLFDGDIVGTPFVPFEANPKGSGLADFLSWVPKTGGKLTDYAMYGWVSADLAYQGIKAVGPSFTRSSVIAATNKLTDYDAGGLVVPVDWSRQHQAPTQSDPITHGPKLECFAFLKVVSGSKLQIVGGTNDKPFACWETAKRNWYQPVPTSFGS